MDHMTPEHRRHLIVAMTGASGVAYGIRLLEMLAAGDVHTHLLVSPSGWMSIEQECDRGRVAIESLAGEVHNVRDIGASIASGSFRTAGMVVAPCSMKTLSAIAHAYSDNLITRAADVTLKERRRLVLVTREAPLTLAHLRNMTLVSEMGGIVFPPVPAFYHRPSSIDEIVEHGCERILDLFDLSPADAIRWRGRKPLTGA